MYNVADFSFLLDIVDNLTDNLCNSVKGPGMYDVRSRMQWREMERKDEIVSNNVSIGTFQTHGELHIWPTLESGSKNKGTAKLLEMIMDLLCSKPQFSAS